MRKLLFIALLLLAGSVRAAQLNSSARTLLLGGGARSAALQGAYTAVAGDVDSLFYNAGGLSAVRKPQLSLTHSELLLGSNYDVAAYAHPLSFGTLGVSVGRLSPGEIDGRDENGHPIGGVTANDEFASVAFSKDFFAMVGAGANIKFFQSRIGADEASTVACDLGSVVRWPGRPLWFGLSALNIGHGLTYIDETSPLPLTLAVGAATRISNVLNLTMDIKQQPHDHRTEVVTGFEVALAAASLRAGYAAPIHAGTQANPVNWENLQGGVGVAISNYQLDYAISSQSETGMTHRLTLSTIFR